MALMIETGAIVEGADSYVTRADYIAYAASMGVTVEDTVATDVQLRKAAQFIDSKEHRLKGVRVSRDQPLAFPRDGVSIDNWSWSKTEIPRQVLLCQLALALDIHAGVDLYNPVSSAPASVKRERVEGVVDIEYAISDSPAKLSRESSSTALLNSLMKRSGMTLVRN